MYRFLLSLLLVAGIVASPAVARFELKDATYFCTAEISAGLAFNKSTKKWESTTFKADEKFVLRMKYLRVRNVKDSLGKEEAVFDFNVSITKAGTNYASPCNSHGSSQQSPITVNQYDVFRCNSSLMDYVFNGNTNRFLQTYVGQYIQGDDGDTPAVTGGTCTKID